MTVEITKTLDFLKCPGTAEVTLCSCKNVIREDSLRGFDRENELSGTEELERVLGDDE